MLHKASNMLIEDHPFLRHYFELELLRKSKDESLVNQINFFARELWFEIKFDDWKNDFKHRFHQEIKQSDHYD